VFHPYAGDTSICWRGSTVPTGGTDPPEQGIDTSTAEGRAMFGMPSVLAELQRELIIANTRDGLAAARACGRVGGRRPKLTPAKVRHAQQLYDAGDHTVQQIADLLRVPRTTVYGHLDKTTADHRPKVTTTIDNP
jgi:DNA invertase Pin-like site-specific DNA recombinase